MSALLPAAVPGPRSVLPLKNSTVPVGVGPPLAVTVAVKVTDWPNTDGLAFEASVVDVPARLPPLTTWERAADELPQRLDSVLRVVYLVFNEGYLASSGASLTRVDLSGEAIHGYWVKSGGWATSTRATGR